jgi:hypothetical protein
MFLMDMGHLRLVTLLLMAALPAWPCSCAPPRPACAYFGADAIFTGRVAFTNDDGSGKFTQATLVRFEVEESFKGLAPGTKVAWADPGSFSSCYQAYRVGERWLIFARRSGMSITGRQYGGKPVPPDIDPAHPPEIYAAEECSGSRQVDEFPNIEMDYAMLKDFRAGKPLPRVLGWVFLDPFRGWPILSGPKISHALVTIWNEKTTLRATTRADGTFTLDQAPEGWYRIKAELPPYASVDAVRVMYVPEMGCGSQDAAIRTASEIRGIVLDSGGRPAAGIPVWIEVPDKSGPFLPTIETKTAGDGTFALQGLPAQDVRLAYGSDHPSSTRVRYPRVNQPGLLRLALGEKRAGMVLWLPPPPRVMHVDVTVMWPNGGRAGGVWVEALHNGMFTESVQTGSDGRATLPCLNGLAYEIESSLVRASSAKIPLVCSDKMAPLRLTLDQARSY